MTKYDLPTAVRVQLAPARGKTKHKGGTWRKYCVCAWQEGIDGTHVILCEDVLSDSPQAAIDNVRALAIDLQRTYHHGSGGNVIHLATLGPRGGVTYRYMGSYSQIAQLMFGGR